MLIHLEKLGKSFGEKIVLHDVTASVEREDRIGIVGQNGAGKTTTMHAISGLLKLQSGEIDYCGQTISKMEAHKIIRLGLAQVPEGRRVFSGLTVQQNLQMGAYTRRDGKEAIQNDFDMVFDLLPRLKERRNQPAGTLSGGEQQRVAIARALAKNPKLLLCDEPTGALDYQTGKQVLKVLQDTCRTQNKTVIVITHNLALTPMGDKVIKVRSGKIESITCNEHPMDVNDIEY